MFVAAFGVASIASGLFTWQLAFSPPSGADEPEPLSDEALDCPTVTDPDGNDVYAFSLEHGSPIDAPVTEIDPDIVTKQQTPEGALASFIEADPRGHSASEFALIHEGERWRDYALDRDGRRLRIVRVIRLPVAGIWEASTSVVCES